VLHRAHGRHRAGGQHHSSGTVLAQQTPREVGVRGVTDDRHEEVAEVGPYRRQVVRVPGHPDHSMASTDEDGGDGAAEAAAGSGDDGS
jgi:hypothetical protein